MSVWLESLEKSYPCHLPCHTISLFQIDAICSASQANAKPNTPAKQKSILILARYILPIITHHYSHHACIHTLYTLQSIHSLYTTTSQSFRSYSVHRVRVASKKKTKGTKSVLANNSVPGWITPSSHYTQKELYFLYSFTWARFYSLRQNSSKHTKHTKHRVFDSQVSITVPL